MVLKKNYLNLKNLNPSLPILVVDSETNFIFKPLMYEVLSKEIRSWEATPKFVNIFSDAGITFLRNHLTKISFKENILEFSDELKLSYQYLVICTGSIPNSFLSFSDIAICLSFLTSETKSMYGLS